MPPYQCTTPNSPGQDHYSAHSSHTDKWAKGTLFRPKFNTVDPMHALRSLQCQQPTRADVLNQQQQQSQPRTTLTPEDRGRTRYFGRQSLTRLDLQWTGARGAAACAFLQCEAGICRPPPYCVGNNWHCLQCHVHNSSSPCGRRRQVLGRCGCGLEACTIGTAAALPIGLRRRPKGLNDVETSLPSGRGFRGSLSPSANAEGVERYNVPRDGEDG